ncbi:MAG: hypothetical protein WDW38_006368 [Sanguina aurantia]
MVDAETMLLAMCRIKFSQRTDFGKEYFEGDILRISRLVLDVAEDFRPSLAPDAPTSCVVTEEETGCGEASDVDSDDAAEEDTDTDTDTDPTSSPSSEAEEPNPAVFAAHGFSVTGKRINVCLRCKKKALLGCCPLSRDMKRGKKFLVLNMEMLPDVEEDMDDWNFGRYKVAR